LPSWASLRVLVRHLFAFLNPPKRGGPTLLIHLAVVLEASFAVEHRARFGFDQLAKAPAPACDERRGEIRRGRAC